MESNPRWWNWMVVLSLAVVLQTSLQTQAQNAQVAPDSQASEVSEDSQGANAPDPPSRVARLNFIDGSVSFQPGGEDDWVTADLNRPVVTGDNLWADENSRAEVHIGSTALRLGAKTGISLLEISDRAAQIRLAQGSLVVKVRHVDDEDAYEIDTPNVAFVVMQPGEYRLTVDPDGNRTQVTVWHGRGEVTGGGSSYTVVANQQGTFTGSDQLNYDLAQIPQQDGFDRWASERDQEEERSDSANYVSREMTGYEDLDDNGDWSYVAGYGTCWRPRLLVAGWAPYRFGHWAWIGPWGWTWIEAEPWGFAPFHYGRWAFAGGGWLWVPGPGAVRPVYAPALVAWVGGLRLGAGVGWVPLAPGEVFVPGYRVSRTYVNRVNITNTTVNVTKVTSVYNTVVNRNAVASNVVYANRSVGGGVTVVSHETFVNARPVARNVVPVPEKDLAAAPVSHIAAVEPTRSSVIGAGVVVSNRPPAAVTSRSVVALRIPAPMPRSFDQQQANAGVHMNQSALNESGANQPTSSSLVRQERRGIAIYSAPPTRQPQSDDGFRSFVQPTAATIQEKPKPRVWEAQGTPEPEKRQSQAPQNRASPPAQNRASQAAQNRASQLAQQSSRPLAKSVTPVQQGNNQQQREEDQKFSNWHQQTQWSGSTGSTTPAPSHSQQSVHTQSQTHTITPKK